MPSKHHTAKSAKSKASAPAAPASTRSQRNTSGPLTVSAYAGDGAALIAFDLDAGSNNKNLAGLAGFAIYRTPPNGKGEYLPNRLSFGTALTSASTSDQREWTPSITAPFQKFRWVDFVGPTTPGRYTYIVTAMYFAADGTGGAPLRHGPSAKVSIHVGPFVEGNLEIGFTRSYVSSQAYARRYGTRSARPDNKKTLDYSAAQLAAYKDEWEWLGAHGGKLVNDFLDRCVNASNMVADVFAYDLDEPTVVDRLEQLGPRLRLYLDNAPLHTKKTALEPAVARRVAKSAGADHVKRGHFKRFAHNKIIILRDKKTRHGVAVLTGSANFSIRGLYVQANNVLVFDDRTVAQQYADVFDAVWANASAFSTGPLAKQWFPLTGADMPSGSQVAFSPHQKAAISLDPVAAAITGAKASVLFAVMELSGSGKVMDAINALPKQTHVFYYGVTQTVSGGAKAMGGSAGAGVVTPFAYLHGTIPAPFRAEVSGGAGQVIHHKFVVVDFNGSSPRVFTGSSNFAAGGETENGDNMIEFTDPGVAIAYGVEAVRLVDHFHFRAAWHGATNAQPLMLQGPNPTPGKEWWAGFYDQTSPKAREREMLR